MKKSQTSSQKSERGQSLLEFGISLVVLLMLLTGAVEFGMALFQFITIRDAAQEGAVYGSIYPTGEEIIPDIKWIKWRAMDAASDVVQLTEANVDVCTDYDTATRACTYDASKACEGETGNLPNSITVVVVFNHPITFPFVADMVGNGNIRLTGRATNTILRPTCP